MGIPWVNSGRSSIVKRTKVFKETRNDNLEEGKSKL